ncbi:putative ankyrin repeat protein L93 [Madurella mycetomatis]|uniref:Ankyrin repeat protein L93 n=1 Tax=Madurella mycetomatis TaxID=100816 RepID=A0A175W285_9PEZI|nr:putative ankyrin repeat protein L93 [Madurella mycetomatis]
MDPFSAAAGAVAFGDAAGRLAQSCVKLYEFWNVLQETPADLKVIQSDLESITGVLKKLSGVKLEPEVATILNSCQKRVHELAEIIGRFDIDSVLSAGKHRYLLEKCRMRMKMRHVEKLQMVFRRVRDDLMLGLMIQSIRYPALSVSNQEINIALDRAAVIPNSPGEPYIQLRNPLLTKSTSCPVSPTASDAPENEASKGETPEDRRLPEALPRENTPLNEPPNDRSAESINRLDEPTPPRAVSSKGEETSLAHIAASAIVQKFMEHAIHLAMTDLVASGTVGHLLESSLSQVTSFDTAYSGSYTSEEYNIRRSPSGDDASGATKPSSAPREQTMHGPRLSRSRVCHQKSSIGVVLGSIWIRTSTLKVSEDASIVSGRLEVITSVIFYPCSWLQRFGLQYGTEASLQWSPTAGWMFNISAIRAIPEDSLIFDMCRQGSIDGVKVLLARKEASLKDTSPKGWTPLHFAATHGHVDLCRALIDLGADKQALAFVGPTAEALSPLAIWSELCRKATASEKIDMIGAFGPECLDITELNGDGWIVGHNLIASMSQEQCDMSKTAVNYVFALKQSDIMIALGAKSVWHGLQQAIRGFLIEEHMQDIAGKLVSAELGESPGSCQSRIRAIGHWLALRASQRDLVPLAIQAAQILQVQGYDPLPGSQDMERRDLNRKLPLIYTMWAKTSARVLANVREIVKAEFSVILGDMSMDCNSFARRLSTAPAEASKEVDEQTRKNHYSNASTHLRRH